MTDAPEELRSVPRAEAAPQKPGAAAPEKTLEETKKTPPAWALARPDIVSALVSRPGRLRLALTGGAAAGKSRAAEFLAGRGLVSIDMDVLSRRATAPGTPGLAAVLELFGPDFLGPDGALDRAKIGRAVFAEPESRLKLEGLLHPLIWDLLGRELAADPPAAVISAPLLFEAGLAPLFRPILLVFARPETQMERLLLRRPDMSREEAELLLAAQWPAAAKVRGADFIVNNDGPWPETEARLLETLSLLRRDFPCL